MIPETHRMCIVSRVRLEKARLFRLVKKDGVYIYDRAQNLPGRGIYVEKSEEALKKLEKKHLLDRLGKAPLKEGELLAMREDL